VSDPFTEIPADMLLFHICIPFAVEHFRPRATIKAGLFHWFSSVGWALGLCDFLLPGPEETNGNNDERERERRVEEGQVVGLNRNPAQVALDEQLGDAAPAVNIIREEFSEYDDDEEGEEE
jgi:E3 ubiquitin-protein ligase MARCH6